MHHPSSIIQAYTLSDTAPGPVNLILVASGSEVQLCVSAQQLLSKSTHPSTNQFLNIRVVSFPCWKLFEQQPLSYRTSVFPPGIPVLSVEAMSGFGWEKYSHASICMGSFGASAPAEQLAKVFGFSVDNVVARGKEIVAMFPTLAPDLSYRWNTNFSQSFHH